MIEADELVVGNHYFLLLFYHPKIEIPMIETWVYVGKNLDENSNSDDDEYFFQDPKSYLDCGSFTEYNEKFEHEIFLANRDTLFQMYNLDELIGRLSKIAEH